MPLTHRIRSTRSRGPHDRSTTSHRLGNPAVGYTTQHLAGGDLDGQEPSKPSALPRTRSSAHFRSLFLFLGGRGGARQTDDNSKTNTVDTTEHNPDSLRSDTGL